MREIYQKSWFEIEFDSLNISTSNKEIANVKFYKEFYKEFYKKYHCYDDLPKRWIALKMEIANHILELVNNNSNFLLLSIGCGNGFIENKIIESGAVSNIIAIEPGGYTDKWINKDKIKFYNGLFPEAIKNDYNANELGFVYASGIDYVFDDKEYLNFLKSVKNYGIKNFLLTEIFIPNKNILSIIKHNIQSVLSRFGYDRGQFWGYLRTIDEHIYFLREAGFKNKLDYGKYAHGGYWILVSDD